VLLVLSAGFFAAGTPWPAAVAAANVWLAAHPVATLALAIGGAGCTSGLGLFAAQRARRARRGRGGGRQDDGVRAHTS